MADLINEIVSPEALAQLDELKKSIDDNAKALKDLAAAGRGLDFSKAKTLSDLGEWSEKYEKTIQAMTAANQNYANNLQKAIVLKQQLNGSTKEVVATYDKLEAAELKAAKTAEIREKAAQRAAAEAEKAAKREEKALRELNNEYELLKKAYKDAADKAKELGVSFGTNSKVFKDAAANAKVMYDRLLKVEMAVGQGQRAVGQYNQAAFAMQQILRDTPAFANSFATGIMAISNNIPILADEIKRLKLANDELRASGAKTIPVWKVLFDSILSPMGLLSLAVTGLTILSAKVDIFATKTDAAKESVDELTKSLNHYGEAAADNQEKQVKNAEALTKIIEDSSKSEQVRKQAIDELQKAYPQYLENLKAEDMLKGKAYETLQKIKEEIEYRTQLQSLEEEGIALRKQEMELRIKANTAETREDQYTYRKALQDVQEQIKNNTDQFNKYKVAVLTFPVAKKEEKEKKDKQPKAIKDDTLKSETDLIKAIYDNKQKELEITRDTNNAIADDTKQEMADRLVAYENYTAAVLQLARLERDMTIDIENEKIEDIERKRKTAKGKELSNLLEQERAAYLRINTAEKEFGNQQATITRDSKKDILGIVHSANEEWVKDEEAMYKDLKTNQAASLLVEEAMLKSAYENKEMTRKEYNKRVADLQRQQREFELQTDIEFDKKILANDQLSAEDRRRYKEKLLNDTKALAALNKGKGGGSRSGRFTDSLAMLFAPSDLENEEQYLQAFYDHTIQLANTAADAIIAAKKRTFQAEMDNLDKQKEGIQTNYDMQVALINATGKSEADKANKISQLNAQRMLQEQQIEQKKREIAQKQAAYEKTAAIASIIQSTAVAIAGALKYGPAAPPIIALIAATGAAQLAAAANAPIPAYKEGTDYHKGGAFIAGDGGEPELIVAPNKSPYWSNSVSTLYSEGAGTKVIPMSDIMQYTSTNTDDFSSAQLDALATRVAKSFDKTGYKIAQVIQASKPNINMSAVAEEMRRERNLQGK